MLEHLEELRQRLIRILSAVFVLAVLSFIYMREIFENILLAPKKGDFFTYILLNKLLRFLGLRSLSPQDLSFAIQNVEMTGQFSMHLHLAFMSALVVCFPYIFWESFGFIRPALHEHERKATRFIVLYSALCMALGLMFGYFVLTPLSVQFFGGYVLAEGIQNNIYLTSYLAMVVRTTFYSGILFQLPVLVYILGKMGLIDAQFLRQYRKHAVLIILLLAAFLTPPDFVTQIVVALPLFLLYEMSIYVCPSALGE